ncbi:MAG: hypothetical protein WAW84_01310 [Candidatus Rickettsiella isopodorum]|nr:hypothetical protein [Pseudomonadota bacterium]
MANVILDRFNVSSKLSSEIEEYLEKQMLILEYLKKARSKAQVALSDDFLDYEPEIIHHYLWSLGDRLEITTSMFEGLVDVFITIRELVCLH